MWIQLFWRIKATKALFGANLNNVIFQIWPYSVLYLCFMNKTVQNAYNIWCKVDKFSRHFRKFLTFLIFMIFLQIQKFAGGGGMLCCYVVSPSCRIWFSNGTDSGRRAGVLCGAFRATNTVVFGVWFNLFFLSYQIHIRDFSVSRYFDNLISWTSDNWTHYFPEYRIYNTCSLILLDISIVTTNP